MIGPIALLSGVIFLARIPYETKYGKITFPHKAGFGRARGRQRALAQWRVRFEPGFRAPFPDHRCCRDSPLRLCAAHKDSSPIGGALFLWRLRRILLGFFHALLANDCSSAWRISARLILPPTVLGSSSTYSMMRGYLYGAVIFLTWTCSSLVSSGEGL